MEVISKCTTPATKKYDRTVTLGEIIKDFAIRETRLCVVINDKFYPELDITHKVRKNDVVFIYPEFAGGRNGIKIASTIITLAAVVASGGIGAPGFGATLTAGQLAAARVGILVGSTLIVAGLQAFAPRGLSQQNGLDRAESPTYSLTSSGNSLRPYQPFPVILGQHNIFPDFSARPYNEYDFTESVTIDANGWVPVNHTENQTIHNVTFNALVDGVTWTLSFRSDDVPLPTFCSNWYRYNESSPSDNHDYGTLGVAQENPAPTLNQSRVRQRWVYVENTAPFLSQFINRWVSFEDLVNNGQNANFQLTGFTFSNPLVYEYQTVQFTERKKTQVVKQIMNYGFGDLQYLQNKIGITDASDYRDYNEELTTQSALNWTLFQNEPDFSPVNSGSFTNRFNNVPGNVDTIQGGRLDNNNSFKYPDNYVIRQGPENCYGIQVDIEGRLFQNDIVNGGFTLISRQFNVQYRQVFPAVSAWFNFPNDMDNSNLAPLTIVHASVDVYRNTLWVDDLAPGQYEVRARKIDVDEQDKNSACDIEMKVVRFYQSDVNQNYVAQNRKAIIIEAGSQLNGQLQNLSSLTRARCWENDGAGNFSWGFTSNPADWFLYFARGGFKNTSANGSFVYPFSPTVGWVNSADHPDNGERLFGGGISDDRIDFTSITNWWNFCDAKGLTFNAVLDDPQSVAEVLRKICQVGRASPTWAQGKLGVVFEDVNDVPVAMFGPENIIRDSFEYSYLTEDLPDEVIVNFMNPDKNWQQDNVRALLPGVTTPTKSVTVDYWGITNEAQAQREANLILARQLYQRRLISFKVDAEGIIVTRGDVILLSHDVTTWDHSSRILSTTNDTVNITSFTINEDIAEPITHCTIRTPNNDLLTLKCTVFGNVVTLVDPWPLTDAPGILDDDNTVNPLSQWPDSIPEDFLAFIGERATPGKKCRIIGISPETDNSYTIECIDEEAGFYAQEFSISGVPPAEQYERIKAEVVKASYILRGAGVADIYWELSGAIAVTIQISINGSGYVLLTQGNGATIFGESTQIQYAAGDQIDLIIDPVYVDAPFQAVSKTLSMVLE